ATNSNQQQPTAVGSMAETHSEGSIGAIFPFGH
ncbi:MAG: hypothetical protein DK303_001471, partial [Chloroflexi bacterium]